MGQEMNKTQKDLDLLEKINRVIKCINAVYRQKDLQHLFANMESVLSEKADDCKIDFNAMVLNKYMPINDINQIFTHTGSVIHARVEQIIIDKKPGYSTIETRRWNTISLETELFTLSDKDLKKHVRNHLLFECAKKIESRRGTIRRQLILIDKMEAMVTPTLDSKSLVIHK